MTRAAITAQREREFLRGQKLIAKQARREQKRIERQLRKAESDARKAGADFVPICVQEREGKPFGAK